MADAGIYRVRPDGSDLRLIIPGGAFPAWSPDGTRLAFVKGSRDLLSIMRGEKADRIFVASVDGSSQTEIPLTVQRKALYRDLNWAD
jgi:Tol biopolymer transport system component